MSSPVTRIRDNAERMPRAIALRDKDMGIWREWTWAEYWDQVQLAGHAFLDLGVAPGDRVAIHAENRPEWLVADMGALAARAASVGVYPTNPSAEVGYLLGDSGTKVLVAEDQEQVDKAFAVLDQCPDLTRIVYLEPRGIRHRYDHELLLAWPDFLELGRRHRDQHPDALAEVLAGQAPDDLATLIYTSGTTGPPKGAMLTVANVEFAIRILIEEGAFTDPPPGPKDLTLSYLPLSHVAERIFTTWFNAAAGTQVNFAESIETVPQNLREVQPTILFGVPRIWEKLLAGIEIRLSGASWLKRRVAKFWLGVADGIGERLVETGGRHTTGTRLRYAVGHVFFYRALKDRLGMRKVRYAASGAAPIAPEVLRFFMGIGVPMHEVYGMTENTAVATGNRPGRVKLGTVGEVHPGTELQDRRGDRRDPHPARRRVRRLLAQGRGDPADDDRGRLAAHRRRRRVGGRHARPDHRPDEGHHHHRGRQERLAVDDRERTQGLAVHQGGHRHRRRAQVPVRPDRHRARHRRRVGAAPAARLQHLPRPHREARGGRAGLGDRQGRQLPLRAGRAGP